MMLIEDRCKHGQGDQARDTTSCCGILMNFKMYAISSIGILTKCLEMLIK